MLILNHSLKLYLLIALSFVSTNALAILSAESNQTMGHDPGHPVFPLVIQNNTDEIWDLIGFDAQPAGSVSISGLNGEFQPSSEKSFDVELFIPASYMLSFTGRDSRGLCVFYMGGTDLITQPQPKEIRTHGPSCHYERVGGGEPLKLILGEEFS
ncbi:MAG: hypothetical protein V3V61_05615 [Gammaproteobacteria bacterium]